MLYREARPEENAQITRAILTGAEQGAKRQAVCLNAGAALYIAGKAETIAKGVRRAEQLLDSGAAKLAKLEEFIRESNAEEQSHEHSGSKSRRRRGSGSQQEKRQVPHGSADLEKIQERESTGTKQRKEATGADVSGGTAEAWACPISAR